MRNGKSIPHPYRSLPPEEWPELIERRGERLAGLACGFGPEAPPAATLK